MRRPAWRLQGQYTIEHTISLPEEINAGTKQAHTHLNRLILARLPLALPPHSNNPNTYSVGLLHFAPVYITFESVWLALLSDAAPGNLTDPTEVTKVDERIHMILKRLYIPELLRSERLCQDLIWLLHLPPDQPQKGITNRGWPRVSDFTAYIEASANAKPHVLVAYAWVMYMALFNGGRWMRSELSAAGDAFWSPPSHILVDQRGKSGVDAGLRFFHFDGLYDGEEIKHDFKSRLTEIEVLFTPEEKQDIVREAEAIFMHCTLLVEELDDIVAAQKSTKMTSLPQLLLKHLLPMGMVELFQDIRR